MPSVLTSLPGRATVGIEIVSDDGAREQLLLPSDFSLDSSARVDAVGYWCQWSIQLRATSRAVYERRIIPLLLSAHRRITIRWGIDTGTNVTWGPIEFCRVLRVSGEMQNNAATDSSYPFEMSLVGELYELDIQQRIVARNGKISDIVEQIAKKYGLGTLIEPTGDYKVTLIQSYETDFQFLMSRLRPVAVNTSGIAGYYLYVQDGVLHFHTRDYKQEPMLLYYNLSASNLISSDDVQDHARVGGDTTTLVTYDPLEGRTLVTDTNPLLYAKFGKRISGAEGGALWKAHSGPNQISFEINQSQANYSLNRDQYERVSFSGVNMLGLRAGCILNLQLSGLDDSSGGYYYVERINMKINGGSSISVITTIRGELNGGRSGGSIREADSISGDLPPPFSAIGRDPNFSVASSTSIGQGAAVTVRPSG